MSAETQNLILFEKMAKTMIEGDLDNFQEATSLLTTWLSERQAYYPGALLQIVRLLFIAQLRVRNEVRFNHALPLLFKAQRYSENPFAAAYISLVNAILPFRAVFLEGDKGLREGYQQLIASVSEQRTPQTLPPTPQSTNSVESASRSVVPPTPILEATPSRQVPSVTGLDPVLDSPAQNCTPNERIGLQASAETRSPTPTVSFPTESATGPSSSETGDNTLSVNPEAGERDISTPTDPPASALPQQIDADLPANYDDPYANLPRSDISAQEGLHNESLTETAGVTLDSTPVAGTSAEQNPPLESAEVASQMEVDFIEVQKPWNEPIGSLQDLPHLTDNTLTSDRRNEAPSRGESIVMGVDKLGSNTPISPPNPVLIQAVNELDSHIPSHSMGQMDFAHAGVGLSIIARQQGLKDSFRILIDFDITSDRFELIKKWSKRLGDLVELKASLCISLGCYLLADLKEQFETRSLSSFEQLLSCTPSKWPHQRGILSLKVISAQSKEENLPLSPPFHATPDNLLDISGLVAEGRNQIQLHQTTDLRHFLFVLHAHHPTRQQLEQVQHYEYKTKEWQQFLENFASPFAYDSFTSLSCNQAP